jgi:3-hydroxy-9,10-secoandrosta-1,3,5(10)-triene-9,17-dione monooxygenase
VLDGHWEFASGSLNCDLDLLLAPVERPGARPGPPEMRLFILERAAGEYEIVDTWHAMGLKGTASNDIVVREQWIPEHRTIAWAEVNHTPENGVSCRVRAYTIRCGTACRPGTGWAGPSRPR